MDNMFLDVPKPRGIEPRVIDSINQRVIIRFVHDTEGNSILDIPNITSTWKQTADMKSLARVIDLDVRALRKLVQVWELEIPEDVVQITGFSQIGTEEYIHTVVKPLKPQESTTAAEDWPVVAMGSTFGDRTIAGKTEPLVIEILVANDKVNEALEQKEDL